MKEYDLYVPLFYNDGRPIEAAKFLNLQKQLLDQFEGLTYFPQANRGFWKVAEFTYRDEIVIYRVITSDAEAARTFLIDLKKRLKEEFAQEELLIVEREVETL